MNIRKLKRRFEKSFKKAYPKFHRYYRKALADISSLDFGLVWDCSDYVAFYLRYMRDYHLLMTPFQVDVTENLDFNALCMAVAEYDESWNCVEKYYTALPEDDGLKTDLSGADAPLTAYLKEHKEHWNTFWSLVAEYAESWTDLNGIEI